MIFANWIHFSGFPIPIRCVMADQSASVFGQGCFHAGQMKISLGTGSFLDVNTGTDIHASMKGLVTKFIKYPLIAFFASQLQQNFADMEADLEAGNSKFILHA